MNNSILTNEEFKEVKSLLPRGSMAKIARKLNVHRNSVEYVLQGRWYNAEILEEAIKIANEVKLKRKKQAEKFKEIIA